MVQVHGQHRRTLRRLPRCLSALATAVIVAAGARARADGTGSAAPPAPSSRPASVVDRVAVRYFAPEVGGPARPRFLTERMLALEARFEALADGAPGASVAAAVAQERYVRAAMERHVTEDLLASLLVTQGTEPPDLPRRVEEARFALLERVGGAEPMRAALAAESVDDLELTALLRRRVRAAAYVDRAITPILHPTEEQLREAFRAESHPYKNSKLEAVRTPFARWYLDQRLRAAETSFFQSARPRIDILVVPR